MQKQDNEWVEHILECVKKLPLEAQEAVVWLTQHFDLAEEICKNSTYSREELRLAIENARKQKNYLYLVLLLLYKIINQQGSQEVTAVFEDEHGVKSGFGD